MPEPSIDKLKMLTLLEILREKTDALYGLTMAELIAEIRANAGYSTERKAVGRDIETLRAAGFNIEQRREGRKTVYALIGREFTFDEMIWIVDAVQSCPSLTIEKSDHLIGRVQALASESQRKKLQRNVDVPNRVKLGNEDVLKNLDILQQCKRLGKVAKFRYFDYDTSGKEHMRYHGMIYELSIVNLTFTGQFYYAIGWYERAEDFRTFRVDRMKDVQVGEEDAIRNREIAAYNADELEQIEFNMYGLDPIRIKLLVNKNKVSMVVDKFGPDMNYYPTKDGEQCNVHVKAVPGPPFFGWLAKFGNDIKIVSPSSAVEAYKEHLQKCLERYD